MAIKKGLGKGLDALFEDNSTAAESGVVTLKLTEIEPNKNQPRKDFDQNSLGDLADSIKEYGIIQPLIVRPLTNGEYQLVAGERRWRAARMAGITEVPVIIREMSDTETAAVALIENLQREDLNPIEEALGFKELMESYNMTQEEVSKKIGKSRPVITNSMRLLNLPEPVVEMIRDGRITSGHGRALLGLGEDTQKIIDMAQLAAAGNLTVRDIEKEASKKPKQPKKASQKPIDNYFREMEIALNAELGKKVTISNKGEKGTITIEFYSKEELSDIAKSLAK